ncbi:MAG: DNA-directed RNA polymerase subunit alpha [Firmicutes bacterium]|nr:DNA-directed RNA polymerase subunit alpha [Bacillota bacterium]
MSSIPGAAVTEVRFDDALHEFTYLEGIKEDVSDIILNIKDLVVTCESDEPVMVRIDVRGPAEVTAADIRLTSDVEILNPDLHIASLNDKARLALDLLVEKGKGYLSAERSSRSGTIGVIPIDAIFSPVRRVSFQVEPTRVEHATNYDRLVMDIETDGSISPKEALASAGATLRALMSLISDLASDAESLELADLAEPEPINPDLELPIEDLELTERPRNCLKRAQVNTIGQLITKTADDLLAITNFGQKSLDEVISRLEQRGLSIAGGR